MTSKSRMDKTEHISALFWSKLIRNEWHSVYRIVGYNTLFLSIPDLETMF